MRKKTRASIRPVTCGGQRSIAFLTRSALRQRKSPIPFPGNQLSQRILRRSLIDCESSLTWACCFQRWQALQVVENYDV
jgi:hypothetical protein